MCSSVANSSPSSVEPNIPRYIWSFYLYLHSLIPYRPRQCKEVQVAPKFSSLHLQILTMCYIHAQQSLPKKFLLTLLCALSAVANDLFPLLKQSRHFSAFGLPLRTTNDWREARRTPGK